MAEKVKLLWAASSVFKCSRCHTWVVRSPKFLGDADIEGFECEKCGTTSVDITEGRPFGPKSEQWNDILYAWDLYYRDIIEMIDSFEIYGIVKTNPPLNPEQVASQNLFGSEYISY